MRLILGIFVLVTIGNADPIVYGDVTGDGNLTAEDAALVMKYVVGKVETINVAQADVTGNGWVSGFDASWILRKIADPSVVFPVERGSRLAVDVNTQTLGAIKRAYR